MSTPYQVSASLLFSPDTGAPQISIPSGGSGQFTSRQDGILNLSTSGTASIPFGTLAAAGAKVLLIEVDPDTNPPSRNPIGVKINGSTVAIEVAPGGTLLVHDPKPTSGITAIDIAYTSDNIVRYWLMGD